MSNCSKKDCEYRSATGICSAEQGLSCAYYEAPAVSFEKPEPLEACFGCAHNCNEDGVCRYLVSCGMLQAAHVR